jgi:hypothetical protein
MAAADGNRTRRSVIVVAHRNLVGKLAPPPGHIGLPLHLLALGIIEPVDGARKGVREMTASFLSGLKATWEHLGRTSRLT